MSQDAADAMVTEAEVVTTIIRMLGTGASAPTKLYGKGVTITRTSEGLYKVTWSENPGTYLGFSWSLDAATPGNVAGHTVVGDTYDTTAFTKEFLYSEGDDTVIDLQADEWINLRVDFKRTGV
jgi:phenolic acid decarboxylase